MIQLLTRFPETIASPQILEIRNEKKLKAPSSQAVAIPTVVLQKFNSEITR